MVSSTLETSVFSHLPHSKRVYFLIFYTRNECIFSGSTVDSHASAQWDGYVKAPVQCDYSIQFIVDYGTKTTLETSVNSYLSHPFRVCFHIFPTRFECKFSGGYVWIDDKLVVVARNPGTYTVTGVTLNPDKLTAVQVKLHSKRVEKMRKLHSKRVEKMRKLHSKRVEKME